MELSRAWTADTRPRDRTTETDWSSQWDTLGGECSSLGIGLGSSSKLGGDDGGLLVGGMTPNKVKRRPAVFRWCVVVRRCCVPPLPSPPPSAIVGEWKCKLHHCRISAEEPHLCNVVVSLDSNVDDDDDDDDDDDNNNNNLFGRVVSQPGAPFEWEGFLVPSLPRPPKARYQLAERPQSNTRGLRCPPGKRQT
ncbi:hypothetical protein CDEST_09856 [Colletotrichum destructivum]|uniref:Uncharacterized protein n=1 Tax=Colletotrichum destructivum TaxID=34406 RepID=A0AAX4INN1_9PEZI|nr:hypothetical protein CDEST_09856 [Colletotrichum destructivum]